MQREAVSAGPPVEAPADRTQMVYNAHAALEDSLAAVDALAKAAKEHTRVIEEFDPRKMLSQSLGDVRKQALVCLRLFSPVRALRSTRGMESVSALYGVSTDPTERLSTFLRFLRSRLDGSLPCAISVSAVRMAKRSSPSVASRIAHEELIEVLSYANGVDGSGATITAQAVRDGDTTDGLRKSIVDLATLEAECAAATDKGSSSLVSLVPELSRCLNAEAVDALLAHEEMCKRQALALRQIVNEQSTKRAALASVATTTAASSSSPSSSPAGGQADESGAAAPPASAFSSHSQTAPSAPRSTAATSESNGILSRLIGGDYGWKGHAVKAISAALLVLLLRFLMTHLYGAAKSAASLAHGAPSRRRTLTL